MEQKIQSLSHKTRNSSIELLKIIGILLIVISHVIQTLHSTNELVGVQDYVLDLSQATNNIQYLILAMLRSSGAFGITIFFVCSAWFMLDNDNVSKKKMLQILLDIWAVSVIIFFIVFYLKSGNIDVKMIIKQFFPTTFENNWYMTCYLVFYPIHPFLNWIISKMSKKTLLRTILATSFLYLGINYIKNGHFYITSIVIWIVIYFIIAYMKKYLVDISNNNKINLAIFGIGFIGNYGIVLLTNYMGLHIALFSDKILRWGSNCSPFIIMMVIALLNLSRNIHFENKAVNYISSVSLLIYIIHENILLRAYYRPLIWQWVYENYGYEYVLLWTFAIALTIFIFGLIASIVYKYTVQKLVTKTVNIMYPLIKNKYNKIEKILLNIH